jgi:HD-GYP domain-containing protein (c-di-GMP phosphodiesterase class II)
MLQNDAVQPKVAIAPEAAANMAEVDEDEKQTDKGLQDALKRLQAICQVSMALGVITDREKLLHRILECIFDIFPAAQRSFIMLQDKDNNTLVPIAAKQRQEIPVVREEVAISHTIVNEVVTHKRSVLSFDAMDDERFQEGESIINLSIRSMMCAPLLFGEELLGLIQVDTHTGLRSFTAEDLHVLTGISAQAAIAVKNSQLVDDFKLLFDSLVELIATTIDEKSSYTGDHCRRVPMLTMMLAEAVCNTQDGPLHDFHMSDEEMYELKVSALLHDCGKVTTPTHVADKGTKLETIFDRIHLIDTRFEILKRDAEIAYLRNKLASSEHRHTSADAETTEMDAEAIALKDYRQQLGADRAFLGACNIGDEPMSESLQKKVKEIAHKYTWVNPHGTEEPFLSENEIYNLIVPKGTLTTEEREVINSHVGITIKMLETLPYPTYLRRVPKFAGAHHERMDGQGYPKGLSRDQIPIQGRILGIADIFEALTANDRPYKKGKTLTESLHILGTMKEDGAIDPDLFDVFINEQVYLRYAKDYLDPEQLDEVVLSEIPGYTPPHCSSDGASQSTQENLHAT